MRKIETANNFTAKDNFNITGAETLDSVKGTVIRVVGCALGEDVSAETGEVVKTGYLKDVDGNIYSTISPTAMQSIVALAEMKLSEESAVDIRINSRTSKGGRSFIVLTMV